MNISPQNEPIRMSLQVEDKRRQAASLISTFDEQMRQSFYKSSEASSSNGFRTYQKVASSPNYHSTAGIKPTKPSRNRLAAEEKSTFQHKQALVSNNKNRKNR